MNDSTVLMLPALLEEKLFEDDSDNYSISTYPKIVAEDAAHVFIKHFAIEKDNLNISKKKRVKFIDEFAAVALGFPVAEYQNIEIAINILSSWLKSPEMFGDVKRQNKFICRIFKQLTQPFAFRGTKEHSSFQNNFLPLIYRILAAYESFAKERGEMMEEETWVTLIKCALICTDSVICYTYGRILDGSKVLELQMKSLRTLFTIAIISGINSKNVWDIIIRFNKKWSSSYSFLVVWDEFVKKLANMVFARKMKFETKEKFEGGIYVNGKEIATKDLDFIYRCILYSVDTKLASSSPANFQQFQLSHVFSLKDFIEFSQMEKRFFKVRFPFTVFYKLYGQFITSLPLDADEKFDNGLSLALGTIIWSTSVLEFKENDPNRQKLIEYALNIVKINRPMLVSAFIFYGYCFFSKWNNITPYLAHRILEILPNVDIANTPDRLKTDQLFNSASAIFSSSATIYRRMHPEDRLPILKAFNKFFDESNSDSNRIIMLAAWALSSPETLLSKIKEVFNVSLIQKKGTEEKVPYLCTLISMLGTYARFNNKIYEMITEDHTISAIVLAVTSASCRRFSNCDTLLVVTLQTIISIIENYEKFLTYESNIRPILELCTFIHDILDKDNKVVIKNKRRLTALFNTLINRLNIHYPSPEYFTHKDKTIVGTEEDVKVKIGLEKDCKEYNFIVASSILVTFLENKNGKGPLGVISRGRFGRCVWSVQDIFKPENPSRLSDDNREEKIKAREDNELFSTQEHFERININEEVNAPEVEFSGLISEDKKVTEHFKEMFNKWITHDAFCFIDKFDKENDYLRPRVADFLLQLGIVDTSNKLKVKPVKENFKVGKETVALKKIKENFDKLDTIPKVNLTVSQVMLGDEAPHEPITTPAYANFINTISETFYVDGKWCPAIETATGISILQEGESEFPLQIIFNDSRYDFKPPSSKKQTLVITPFGEQKGKNALYNVIETSSIREGVSPFSNLGSILDINTLRVYISLCIDSMPKFIKMDNIDTVSKRKDILKPVFNEKPDSCLAPKVSMSFK